jgi:hypothetical protein
VLLDQPLPPLPAENLLAGVQRHQRLRGVLVFAQADQQAGVHLHLQATVSANG